MIVAGGARGAGLTAVPRAMRRGRTRGVERVVWTEAPPSIYVLLVQLKHPATRPATSCVWEEEEEDGDGDADPAQRIVSQQRWRVRGGRSRAPHRPRARP